ncbi:Phospholipid hydroperoxide glutathione peroxidase, chloroplastic [Porphyridium purpureum]|uniref:Glutathione peroxidase n=1 Tax=Porphyridium purpureum TaxID=35688 RepID=A0A5J4YJB8_PORPP|nr:Phospholipid hydroperoxide glutathione peroxidase, chloroplastic [Porphyridium purpureum]|eukprot:POR9300..scf270_19
MCAFVGSSGVGARASAQYALGRAGLRCVGGASATAVAARGKRSARAATSVARANAAAIRMASLADVKGMSDLDGNPVDFASLNGKVVLAMNVACACGYTKSGYSMVSSIASKLGDKVRVVCFPSNDFGAQEPGSPEEIKSFVSSKFNSPDLLLMEKSHVKGSQANPVFKLAKEAGLGEPKWNFDGKFVFDKTGKPVVRLDNSATESDILAAVQKYL